MNKLLLPYFWSTILSYWTIIFIILFFISWAILHFFKIKNTGIVFVVAHFVFITIFAVLAYKYRADGQAEFIWFIPYQYDLPVSFFLYPLSFKVARLLNIRALYSPYIILLIFGSFQYYIIGRLIDFTIQRIANKKIVKTK